MDKLVESLVDGIDIDQVIVDEVAYGWIRNRLSTDVLFIENVCDQVGAQIARQLRHDLQPAIEAKVASMRDGKATRRRIKEKGPSM